MTQRTNLGAFTPPGELPPYISVNDEGNGYVTITIRGAKVEHPEWGWTYGRDATIKLTDVQFVDLLADINFNFASKRPG